MTDFITPAQFKSRFDVSSAVDDPQIAEHIAAASSRVRQLTGRDFSAHSGAASVRYFRAVSWDTCIIDDAYEITAVATDDGDTGTFGQAWTTVSYETDPANGIGPDATSGWPVTTLRAIGSLSFPSCAKRRAVKVTAKWGWTAVPAAVIEATYLLAHRYYYEVSVPGGSLPPNPEFGLPGAPLRRPYTAEDMLRDYARTDKVIGVAG
jgi:hypothetical protein